MLAFIVMLVLLLALGSGGWGYRRYGYVGIAPGLLVLMIFVWIGYAGLLAL